MQENQTTLKLPANDSAEYKVRVEQRFTINGKPMVNTITEMLWKYKIEEANAEKPIVSIVTESSEVENTPTGFQDLLDFAKLFNRPTERLVLELDSHGELTAVVNQREIFDKWELLADGELAEYKNDESMEGIFVAGYSEFSDTIKSLKTNPLYTIFFDQVYNKNFEQPISNKPNVSFLSKLFQGKIINLKNRQEMVSFDTKVIAKNIYRYFAEDNQETDLADLYQRDFKDAIGPEFEYRYECSSEAEYERYRGVLNNVKAVCLEKANDKLFYETTYKIEAAG